jgi:serine/threonine protein kinase
VKTAVLIAEQLLQRLEYLHAKGVVHQDIKPENCVWGIRERQHHLYLIDFGLSKRYYDRRHIRMHQHSGLIGTARYASVHAHVGLEQSRRDDLEAAGHMLLYFLRGSLPWSGLAAKTMPDKLRLIQKKKETIPVEELCSGFPREFERYLIYCRGLGFKERPDYSMLRQLFRDLRQHLGDRGGLPIKDYDFEWNAGKDLGPLQPLDLSASYPQPDEACIAGRSWLGSCFSCGPKDRRQGQIRRPGLFVASVGGA